jgi:hypothetical protein
MKKETVLEKLNLAGRQMKREELTEIQHNPKLYRQDLLKILKREAAKPQNPTERVEYNDWLYSLYLLAEFRDKNALAPTLKLFSRKGNFLTPLTGDIVLQNLGPILASIANGNDASLKKVIENTEANEYCRAACIEALVTMVEIGEYAREDLYQYFHELFKTLEQRPIFPWSVLCQCAILLYKKSFLKEVKQAFKLNLVDDIFLDMDEIKTYISKPELAQLSLAKKKYGIIVDAVSAMDWWTNFKDKEDI